jgi:hypothetical protein
MVDIGIVTHHFSGCGKFQKGEEFPFGTKEGFFKEHFLLPYIR